MERLTLIAPDLACAQCAATIESIVGRLSGVHQVEAALKSGRVSVLFDAQAIDERAIRRRMAEVGYPVAP